MKVQIWLIVPLALFLSGFGCSTTPENETEVSFEQLQLNDWQLELGNNCQLIATKNSSRKVRQLPKTGLCAFAKTTDGKIKLFQETPDHTAMVLIHTSKPRITQGLCETRTFGLRAFTDRIEVQKLPHNESSVCPGKKGHVPEEHFEHSQLALEQGLLETISE